MTKTALANPRGGRLTLLAVALLVTSSLAVEAQSRVRGQLIIKPPVTTPVDVIVELRDGQNQPIRQIIVDHVSPHRFNDFVPDGINADLQLLVLVKSPEGYTAWQTPYVKRACCEFNQPIILKRAADIYFEKITQAQAQPPDAAIELLEVAAEHAQTLAQTLEVQRQLGQVYVAKGMFAEQQAALEAVYAREDVEALTPARKQAYWGERLDGLLLWSDYNDLRQPSKDFGKVLTENTGDPRLKGWQSFVADFNRAYPASRLDEMATDPTAIAEQLQTINRTLKRPFEW